MNDHTRNRSADAEAAKGAEEDGDTQMTGGEGEAKTATVFPAESRTDTLKMLTFFRKGPFSLKAEYPEDTSKLLLPMTARELGSYQIDLAAQTEPKKVKVRAKLTLSGVFAIEGAQLVEEEEYDETVKEKRELPPAPEEPAADAPKPDAAAEPKPDGDAPMPEAGKEEAAGEEKKEGEAAVDATKPEEKKKEPEKKYEWVDVIKKKKRTKRTDLDVVATGKPGLQAAMVQKQMDVESAMQADMKEIIETDEKKNDLEGYIFSMRSKVGSGGELKAFISQPDCEKFETDLQKAEDWLYDTYDATKVQFVEKLSDLKTHGDAVTWRFKEDSMRGEWVAAVKGTITNYRAAAENPGDKYGHIDAEKLTKIIAACTELEKWLSEMEAKQLQVAKTEKPVLICADMEKKNQELAKMADEILKEPKPAPPKEEKQEEEKKEDTAAAEAPATDGAAPADAPADGPANMDVD